MGIGTCTSRSFVIFIRWCCLQTFRYGSDLENASFNVFGWAKTSRYFQQRSVRNGQWRVGGCALVCSIHRESCKTVITGGGLGTQNTHAPDGAARRRTSTASSQRSRRVFVFDALLAKCLFVVFAFCVVVVVEVFGKDAHRFVGCSFL